MIDSSNLKMYTNQNYELTQIGKDFVNGYKIDW